MTIWAIYYILYIIHLLQRIKARGICLLLARVTTKWIVRGLVRLRGESYLVHTLWRARPLNRQEATWVTQQACDVEMSPHFMAEVQNRTSQGSETSEWRLRSGAQGPEATAGVLNRGGLYSCHFAKMSKRSPVCRFFETPNQRRTPTYFLHSTVAKHKMWP